MTVTTDSFLDFYPEFKGGSVTMIAGHLQHGIDATQGEMSESDRDALVMLSVADQLARSPFAKDLKLVNKDGETTYQHKRRQLLTKVTMHRRHV